MNLLNIILIVTLLIENLIFFFILKIGYDNIRYLKTRISLLEQIDSINDSLNTLRKERLEILERELKKGEK